MHHIIQLQPHIKKILYSGAIYLVIILASHNGAVAQDCCTIDVSFTGIYNDETCEVIVNGKSNSEIVELPTLSTQSLKDAGTEAGSRTFVIGLKECPTNRNIDLKFISNMSQTDVTTGNLLNETGTEYSKNVQIRIRKEDGTQIRVDDLASAQNYYIPESGEMVSHDYIANYYASGGAGATSGLVKATAGIELSYK